ncbi:hypothetical protein NDU88_005227 [Pleurodeles waltl]|uniref:Uncharacterized protein n=1 Tax=Pleurodeles waltl TaxID=8319 RepID=A0AAV7PHF9_PLEWA|nr:hypothetical protein NDU88_005227 [Pleurodeles waltl]
MDPASIGTEVRRRARTWHPLLREHLAASILAPQAQRSSDRAQGQVGTCIVRKFSHAQPNGYLTLQEYLAAFILVPSGVAGS